MDRLDELKQALERFEAVLALPPTTYELEEAKNEFLAAVMNNLPALLPVVEAAREIVADADTPHLARNWATDRLAAALAALDTDRKGA